MVARLRGRRAPGFRRVLKLLLNVAGGAALGLALGGCSSATKATAPPARMKQPNSLSFLVDGKTTRSEVEARLGGPAASLDSDRLWTYRVRYDPPYLPEDWRFFLGAAGMRFPTLYDYGIVSRRDYFPPGSQPWMAANWIFVPFSLVLSFDDGGTLRKHALIQVHVPP